MFRVHIADHQFDCKEPYSLLQAMERAGLHLIPVGCRSGGCGICKVQVTRGDFWAGKMSRSVLSPEEQQRQIVLACRCYALSDLHIQPISRVSNDHFQKHPVRT